MRDIGGQRFLQDPSSFHPTVGTAIYAYQGTRNYNSGQFGHAPDRFKHAFQAACNTGQVLTAVIIAVHAGYTLSGGLLFELAAQYASANRMALAYTTAARANIAMKACLTNKLQPAPLQFSRVCRPSAHGLTPSITATKPNQKPSVPHYCSKTVTRCSCLARLGRDFVTARPGACV